MGSGSKHEIEVTFDQHDLATFVIGINSSGGVTDEKSLDAQMVHHVNGECRKIDWVALIEMEPPLHCDDICAGEPPADQLPLMTGCCALWKERDLFVGKNQIDGDFVGNLSRASSHNNTESGTSSPMVGDIIRGFLDDGGEFQRRERLFKGGENEGGNRMDGVTGVVFVLVEYL